VMAARAPLVTLAREFATLAVAAWLGEETCIAFYRFYAYAPAWHAFLLDVPLLVPLIWPLVVLSARGVARQLAPAAGTLARAALVGAIVAFDASLVEVVAVRAGYWRWAEPGHLDVPLLGVLGWGFFAFGASVARRSLLQIAGAFTATHVLVLAAWWGLFRWAARGELGALGFAPWALASMAGVAFALRARRRGRVLVPEVWGPRVLAASLFVALLVATSPAALAVGAQTALVALPYLAATSLRRRAGSHADESGPHFTGRRSAAAPHATTGPCPPETARGAASPGA